MAAHPKLVQRPLDSWTLRERLLLASAVLQSGDQNWVSVSRAIKNQTAEVRPTDYFSQKNCALQYGHLLEHAETPKRKRSEKNEVIPVETQGHQIVNRLRQEYMEQMVKDIKRQQEEYFKLTDEIEMVSSGHCDEKLSDIWAQIQKKQNIKREAEAPVSMSQSETSVENEQTLSSLTTSMPDADDTSTQDSQEADIEVDDHNTEVPSFSDALNSTLSPQPVASVPTDSTERQPSPTAEDSSLPSAEAEVDQPEVVETTEVVSTAEVVEEAIVDTVEEPAVEDSSDTAAATPAEEPTPEVVESASVVAAAEPVVDVTPEPSVAKSSTEDSNDSIAERVSELSESKSRTKLRQTSKSRQSSETSTHEDINVDDDVMPRPPKVPSPVRTSSSVLTDKPASQLTISVIPAEIEQALSPESTVSSTSDVKSREVTTPTTSSSSRRRSSRVVKIKDDKKEEAASAASTKATSESEQASDDEEGGANTSKTLDITPSSPAASQQSEPDDDKTRKMWKKTLMMIWKNISQHKYANVFMDQVTDEIAPGYSTCVHRPMSLSTIKYNLEKNIIKTTDEFVRDVMLMFVNAMMYNNHEYDVFVMAQEMYDEAMRAIEQHTQYIGKESELKAASRGRRSETSLSADKDVDKGRRRSSADQHTDHSQSAAKKRKTRADD